LSFVVLPSVCYSVLVANPISVISGLCALIKGPALAESYLTNAHLDGQKAIWPMSRRHN